MAVLAIDMLVLDRLGMRSGVGGMLEMRPLGWSRLSSPASDARRSGRHRWVRLRDYSLGGWSSSGAESLSSISTSWAIATALDGSVALLRDVTDDVGNGIRLIFEMAVRNVLEARTRRDACVAAVKFLIKRLSASIDKD